MRSSSQRLRLSVPIPPGKACNIPKTEEHEVTQNRKNTSRIKYIKHKTNINIPQTYLIGHFKIKKFVILQIFYYKPMLEFGNV